MSSCLSAAAMAEPTWGLRTHGLLAFVQRSERASTRTQGASLKQVHVSSSCEPRSLCSGTQYRTMYLRNTSSDQHWYCLSPAAAGNTILCSTIKSTLALRY
ncbi:hypothetical protein PF005_g15818 [Phytophthora fragariae]|uniref:Uncharacterized protein n=1 Tax=Phytophthora fragariae TaxID=53985 RepID=A0A6A3XAH0_9STRA|nr:hypothetical protein PF003_g11522 [Phytophthora fragariae]KAE8933037.1 hypothetical protein PF009_g16948 [Phytophthora fragariae]KAE9098795.1 hypothetical protein PF007_g16125 [Phytophthora fragariae]KAE9100152.1 hypothetical protein PF010_g14915 [Phytophthora fragariae]KAE9125676.1 hypothetical protein PF006_g16906 [Phytophthora fragariae]